MTLTIEMPVAQALSLDAVFTELAGSVSKPIHKKRTINPMHPEKSPNTPAIASADSAAFAVPALSALTLPRA